MAKCEVCGVELEEGAEVCPICGVRTKTASEMGFRVPAPEEDAAAAPATEAGGETGSDQRKKTGLWIAIALLSALVVLLSVLVVRQSKAKKNPASEEASPAASEEAGESDADEAKPEVSYTHDDPAYFTDEVLDCVIATCGTQTLTNRELCFFYWEGFNYLTNYYGSYMLYYMDPTARLDTQMLSDEKSWDQYVMEIGVNYFYTYSLYYNRAKEEGFQLPADAQAELDGIEKDTQAYAEQLGLASAEEYLHKVYGPYATMDGYKKFMELYLTAMEYYSQYSDSVVITEEDIDAFYEENRAEYEENGLSNENISNVDVRHILIMPAEVELDPADAGYEAAQAAAKAEAKAKAEQLLEDWKQGEATEESFAALATENTEDPGSKETGGLYQDVYPGQMVPTFNDWCFDQARQTGDTDVVETDYGFHVMFFVRQTGKYQWRETVREDAAADRVNVFTMGLEESYPPTSDLSCAAVYPVNVAAE